MTKTTTTELLNMDEGDCSVALMHMSKRDRKMAISAMRTVELDRRLASEHEVRNAPRESGCQHCRRTESRTSQIWERCPRCGTMPTYV